LVSLLISSTMHGQTHIKFTMKYVAQDTPPPAMTRNVEYSNTIPIQQFVHSAISASYRTIRIYSKVMNFDVVNAEFIVTFYKGSN